MGRAVLGNARRSEARGASEAGQPQAEPNGKLVKAIDLSEA